MARRAHRGVVGAVQELLDARPVRGVIGLLIVVSLLPYDQVEDRLRGAFLVLFGLELLLRSWVLSRSQKEERGRGDWLFFVVDLLAWISFLPLDDVFGVDTGVLRALRILRLLALVRFTREFAADLWSVLTRREQLQQLGFVTIAVVSLSFVSAVVLYYLRVPHDYDGRQGPPEGFWQQMWWSFRQVESPDNLVPNLANDPVLVLVSLGLTIAGIFVFSYLIGLGTTIVEQVLRAEQRRPVAYRDHTMVVGPSADAELLVREFVRIYDKNRELRRIAPKAIFEWLFRGAPRPRRHALPRMTLLSQAEKAPSYLYESQMRWVVFRRGDATKQADLRRVAAHEAKRAVFLAPAAGIAHRDAITLARLAAFRALNTQAHVFVEITESRNRDLAKEIGGDGTFVLDVPRQLGLFLCHHLLVPGIERLFDELLSAKGNELYTHLYVDTAEHRLLADAAQREVSFAELAEIAHQQGVCLAGVFLGGPIERERSGLIPVQRLHAWVNPYDLPADSGLDVHTLTRETVPLSKVAGFFGLAETYAPMRSLGQELLSRLQNRVPVATPSGIDVDSILPSEQVRRVWVVGYQDAALPMAKALAHFVPQVEMNIVVADPGPLLAAAKQGGIGTRLSATNGEQCIHLEREGRLNIHVQPAHRLASYAAEEIQRGERRGIDCDAAIFLSEPDGTDVDALTALRVLRFVSQLDVKGKTMRLLLELGASDRGEELQRNVTAIAGNRFELTPLSTQHLRNYFMVHSAFVPGAAYVYERLLGHRGQELVYLPLQGVDALTWNELRCSLAGRRCIPLALDEGDTLRTNPPPSHPLGPGVVGVYAIADRDQLSRRFPKSQPPKQ